MSKDDITLRLRILELQRFLSEVRSGNRAIDDIRMSTKALGEEARKTGGGSRSHLGIMSATVSQLRYATAGLVLSLGAGVGAVASMGIKATAQLEQVQAGFTHMLKSKAEAKDLVKQLQNLADWSPFQVADVDKWAQSLIGIGAKKDQIIPTITAVGDAVAAMGGSSEQVNGALIAIEQIAAKAKLSAQELNQLGDNGIFAREILAKGMHTTTGSLMQFLDKGGAIGSSVAIPILLQGLHDQFKGSLLTQSQTVAGLWSTFKDKLVGIIRADPDSPFTVALRKWMHSLIDGMPAIQAWIQGWFVRIWDLGPTIAAVADRIRSTVGAAVASLQGAGASGGAFGIGSLLGGTVPAGADSLLDQVDKWANSVDWFNIGASVGGKSIGFTFGFVSALLDPTAWWPVIRDHWFDVLMVIATLAAGGLTGIFGKLAVVTSKIPFLGRILGPLFRGVDTLAQPIARMVKGISGVLFRAFEREFPRSGALMRHLWLKLYNAATVTIPNLFRAVGPGIAHGLEEGFAYGFRKLKQAGSLLKKIDPVFGLALAIGGAVVTGFVNAWNGLKAGGIRFFDWLASGFVDVVNGFIDSLNSVLSVTVVGRTIGPNIGHVDAPKAARGQTLTSDGLLRVGDAGAETLMLPRGASVIPNQRIASGSTPASGGRGDIIVPVIIDGREVMRAVHRAEDDARAAR